MHRVPGSLWAHSHESEPTVVAPICWLLLRMQLVPSPTISHKTPAAEAAVTASTMLLPRLNPCIHGSVAWDVRPTCNWW